MLFFAAFTFAQNQSNGAVASSITTPTTGEIFRFGPGLVTQLDSGFGFGFVNDRWFSLGRFKTPNQEVYGLRFQLPGRSILMGYQDINDVNPRIQWIGKSGSTYADTDLEFRVSDDFMSTSSTLVATMTHEGKTFFGNPLVGSDIKVGMDYSDVASTNKTGLAIENTVAATNTATGIKITNNAGGYAMRGIDINQSGSTFVSTGINIRMNNSSSIYSGIDAFVNQVSAASSTGTTFGVRGVITSNINVPTFGAGIYGSAAGTNPNWYAGYFNGNVFTTGMYLSSDKKLKEEIEDEENMLEKIERLNAVTYKFKANDQLNLPEGLQHGFIAQNIEEVFPELVTTIKKPILDKENNIEGEFEYKAVNYIGLISVLTSSIQELNEKVRALESGNSKNSNSNNEMIENTKQEFSMEQNIPNPFSNVATIRYTLPNTTKANITIFDMTGKYIREYDLSTTKGELTINSSDIGKGMFLYSLISGGKIVMTKKMMVK